MHEKAQELYKLTTTGSYECVKCLQLISKKGNLSRHTKLCKGKQKVKEQIKCTHDGCSKQFLYRLKMLELLRSHERKQCDRCHRFDKSISHKC